MIAVALAVASSMYSFAFYNALKSGRNKEARLKNYEISHRLMFTTTLALTVALVYSFI